MKETLEYLLNYIVADKEKVKVIEDNTDGYANLKITVGREDIGTVIGRDGKVIRALRNLMKIKAIVDNKRINVELDESLQKPQEQA